MNQLQEIMAAQIKALWKRIVSYRKRRWDIDDYPLRYRRQHEGESALGEAGPWVAQIINWWAMTGIGGTKREAYEDLKENFNRHRENDQLPRPGTVVELVFAETTEIDHLGEIADEFFEKILDMNFRGCFISDLSSLYDFGKDPNDMLEKINAAYHLELTDLGDGNIVRLLKMIWNKKIN